MLKHRHLGFAHAARTALVLAILLCTALLSMQAAFASANGDAQAAAGQAQNPSTRCVKGTVIGHDEKLLTDGWEIAATPRAADGSLVTSDTLTTTSNNQGSFQFDGLAIGTWNFAITVKDGWEPITPASFDVPLDYASTGCLEIRFKLRRIIEVIVLKIDDDHNPWADWTICAEPAADNFFAVKVCQRTNGEGAAIFRLTPGNWTFIETPPPGVPLIPVMPPTDRQSLNVQPPGPYTLRFKNIPPIPTGCIEVTKFDSPPGEQEPFPLPGWQISVLRADGSVAATAKTDAFGRVRFCNLPLGPYTVIEETRKAWTPASDNVISVTVIANETILVEFFNKQDRGFCFEGRKIDANGNVGLPGWIIRATPVAVGGIVPDAATTDGLGYYRICLPKDDYRVPGASYKICEEMQTGWLAHTPTCFVATLPKYPDAPVRVPDFVNQQVGHWESLGNGTTTPPQVGCRATHTVKYGEYLSGIAVQYGVGTYHLMKANPWVLNRYKNYIRPGEQLCIPG